MQEQLLLIAAGLGILISLSLLLQVFTARKANFFLGIVILILSWEVLFSWGAASGYNNRADAFPYWTLLNYNLAWPALWVFVRYNTDDNYKFSPGKLWLFAPAAIEFILQFLSNQGELDLRSYTSWIVFSEYLPIIMYTLVIFYFWRAYIGHRKTITKKLKHKVLLSQLKLLTLMIGLSFLMIFWWVFSFIGWQYYNIIEYILTLTIFGLAFINFLDSQSFHSSNGTVKDFPNYNDTQELKRLNDTLIRRELFLKPNLPLKELAIEVNLPSRYVSYLINQHHKKNYKEYLNEFRIKAFIDKAHSEEKYKKTLLALALESGFSSKSTFNQVFKTQMGKSPSEYLKNT